MSEPDSAIEILVKMLKSEEHRDQIAAADKLLRTENLQREYTLEAVEVLQAIMRNGLAEPRDRVSAADKLKNFNPPREPTARDLAKILAAMTDNELKALLPAPLLDIEKDPGYKVITKIDPLLE